MATRKPSVTAKRDYTRLYVVVRDRFRIQDVALKLLHLLESHRTFRASGEDGPNPYDLLVGITFSLWRAVFLVERENDWDGILANAEIFLEKVIRDNAIGYMDDWNNRKWSFAYYLNNARYRLNEFAEIVPEFKTSHKRATAKSMIESRPFDEWNSLFQSLWDAVEILQARKRPKQSR